MPYELWDIATPKLPARSRLYSLAPIGVGSHSVESVTSYLMRLAEAHAVSPGNLVRTEIFPRLAQHPKRLGCAALHSLNGNGPCFVQWVETLQSLTARNDLCSLTLLPWRGILSADGVSRRRRAWCRRCYQERREHQPAVYDSLLWMLAPATACPLHEILLEELCPHCQKCSLPFSSRGRPGFCSHCDGWLGSDLPVPLSDEPGSNLELRVHTARQIGDLLSFGATQSRPVCSNLRDNIRRAIADWAHGNRLLFCRAAGISDRTLTDWLTGRVLPSLPLLIRLAQNLRVPVKRMLIGELAVSGELWIHAGMAVQAEQTKLTIRRVAARQQFEHAVTRNSMWKLSLGERAAARAEVKTAMETALQEDVPKSVRDIFRSHGYRHCVMGRYWFPDLYAAIQLKRRRRFERYKAELERALNETPPPTVTQVAQRLGVSINSICRAFPALYRQLLLRRPDRRRFEVANTADALKKAFEDAPASLVQLAARLHRNPDKLRLILPELCADLRRRYISHQSMERWKIDLIYEKHVRQAIDQIIATGKYPSCDRVLSFITQRDPTLTSIYRTTRMLKRIRQETGMTGSPIAELQRPSVATIN
jgi:transcriptional regulator with XRE-family HTH domain